MTKTPVEKLVCQMAVPTIVSMLVSAFYNMVDTLYVGRLSTSATGAVGIVFSYMALIQAVGFFFGHGSGNYISRELGRKNQDSASHMAAAGFFSALLIGCAVAVTGLLFQDPLLHLLGATPTILPLARGYLRWILIGTPYMMASLVLNNQMRLQGNAFFAMIGISSGAVLNIVLDPIFIFVLGLGVQGAALATVLSQLVGFLILLKNTGKNGGIRIRWSNFKPSLNGLKEIFAGGFPSLCRQGLASIAVICLNWAARPYGDAAIAAFSIVSRIMNFAGSALLGFGQGFQPVCGFNYGAKLYARVEKAFWFCIKVSAVCLVVLSALGILFAPSVISLFRGQDAELVRIGTAALRYQCVVFPVLGWVILVNMFLQNIRKTGSASLLAMARQGLFFLPLVLLLPRFCGLTGVQLAQPAADFLTFCLALPLGIRALHEMRALNRAPMEQTSQEGH